MRRVVPSLLCLVLLSACAGGAQTTPPPPVQAGSSRPSAEAPGKPDEPSPSPSPKRVDPRKGGLEVGFGEWAVTLEADAIRPGPVTFVVRNQGTMVHGFEIESEGDDGDSSGSGSDNSGSGSDNSGSGSGGEDGLKYEARAFGPGQTVRVPLNLTPGVYKIECFVDGHDDLGMEILLEVRADAPLVAEKGTASEASVALEGFAFDPATIEVAAGQAITWKNLDPAEHTVTAEDGSFDSGVLGQGRAFTARLEQPGTYAYTCQIHPEMQGTVRVSG
jgi:plastocyanin